MPEDQPDDRQAIENAVESILAGKDVDSVFESLTAIREEKIPDATPAEERIEQDEANEFDKASKTAKLNRLALRNRTIELKNRRLELRNQQLDQDRKERERYADRIYNIVIAWLATVGSILVLQGFGRLGNLPPFELAPTVMITAIGSTTASIIGIFIIVARHLFPPKDRFKERSRQKKKQRKVTELE
jgi:hypothetical protein